MEKDETLTKAFCTTREAAKLLGVSLRTVQLWTEAGVLEAWKTGGGHRRVARASLERMFLSRAALPDTLAAAESDAVLRILVVEDEAAVLRVYQRQLGRWPIKSSVITAHNGFDALVKIGLALPDLLVTDLHMPEMDGFLMLRHLRSMHELATITIVVVTGLTREEIEARGGVPSGIPVLPKPIPFDRLRDIATVLADRKRQLRLRSA